MSLVKKYMMRTLNSVCANENVAEVIKLMYKIEASVLPVVDKDNKFLGTIYSENILKNVIPEQYGVLKVHKLLPEVNQAVQNLQEIKSREIKEYMSPTKIAIRETDSMNNVAEIMLENEESRLYVVNHEEKLRGYISRADLLCYLLEMEEVEK
ncbi:CBS domain-containing protein [Natroniella sulfidigena]|uniref:CBS domain-containing protein n=1 Tax=Natroniella sulfidigena TaxID=723921 RepID=UPI00200A17CB|nr:CBS domain-containing protein [Natroniella sulfidigena]MCK8817983.1 CBS domain-containing protein [Natroniella sulfidigena]